LSNDDKKISSTSVEVSSDNPVLSRGFYWVKTLTIPGQQQGGWEPAYFNGLDEEEPWSMIGTDQNASIDWFDEIGPKIICEYQPIPGNV